MIRKPTSLYEAGRSSTLLKVKTFHDAEALVVGHTAGAGKHKGRLGALECVLSNGKAFSVGTGLSDAERDAPPPIGTVISFRYQELTPDGIPRFPSYLGVRDDVAWPPGEAVTASSPPAGEAACVPTTAPPLASAAGGTARMFTKGELVWEISLDGASCTERQRRGLAVKSSTASFSGFAAAWREADARIATKLADGWTEID
jgi:DNA ligase-1